MWLWPFMLCTIICNNVVRYQIINDPEGVKAKYGYDQVVTLLVGLDAVILIFYVWICAKSKFNVHGLWVTIPLVLAGCVVIGLASCKLGRTGTFYGKELRVIKEPEVFTSWPFGIQHPQYKGAILVFMGCWFAFKHTHELTAMTGCLVISLLVQMFMETPPSQL